MGRLNQNDCRPFRLTLNGLIYFWALGRLFNLNDDCQTHTKYQAVADVFPGAVVSSASGLLLVGYLRIRFLICFQSRTDLDVHGDRDVAEQHLLW